MKSLRSQATGKCGAQRSELSNKNAELILCTNNIFTDITTATYNSMVIKHTLQREEKWEQKQAHHLNYLLSKLFLNYGKMLALAEQCYSNSRS